MADDKMEKYLKLGTGPENERDTVQRKNTSRSSSVCSDSPVIRESQESNRSNLIPSDKKTEDEYIFHLKKCIQSSSNDNYEKKFQEIFKSR